METNGFTVRGKSRMADAQFDEGVLLKQAEAGLGQTRQPVSAQFGTQLKPFHRQSVPPMEFRYRLVMAVQAKRRECSADPAEIIFDAADLKIISDPGPRRQRFGEHIEKRCKVLIIDVG